MTVAVRIHQYLRTLSAHLKERAAAMLLAEARDEIDRLRLTDEERFVLAEVRGSLADTDAVVANEQAAVIDGLLERTK